MTSVAAFEDARVGMTADETQSLILDCCFCRRKLGLMSGYVPSFYILSLNLFFFFFYQLLYGGVVFNLH